MNLAAHERQKYEKVWKDPLYARYSPGEEVVPLFKQMVRKRGTLVDIGCGTGRAGAKLSIEGWTVTYMDFVQVTPHMPFVKQNLWTPWRNKDKTRPFYSTWDYGYCADVMEHIPPDKIDATLDNITKHCDKVFFAINFGPDHFGQVIGEPLHLTVKPFTWWRDKLKALGDLREARDLIGMGAFYLVPR